MTKLVFAVILSLPGLSPAQPSLFFIIFSNIISLFSLIFIGFTRVRHLRNFCLLVFLGRAVACAPISGFVIPSLLAAGEVGRVAAGIKQSRAHQIQPGER